jgi:NADH-quinone oxidoreductase subunit L
MAALIHSWPGFLGVGLAFIFYTSLLEAPARLSRMIPPLTKLLEGKYFIDEIYGALIVRPLEMFSRFLWKFVDQGVIDGSVNGTAAVVDVSGEVVRNTESGQLRMYGLWMLVGTVFLICFYFAW